MGQSEREPERWDKCVCVCVELYAEEGGGRENDPTMQGSPKPPLQGEAHRYPISGMTGTKLEPPLILTVFRAPFSAESAPLEPGGRGLGGSMEAGNQNRYLREKEQKFWSPRSAPHSLCDFTPEPQFPSLNFSGKSLCFTGLVW